MRVAYQRRPDVQRVSERCIFCNKLLADAESLAFGAGPDCREKYGMNAAVSDWKPDSAERKEFRAIITALTLTSDQGEIMEILTDLLEIPCDPVLVLHLKNKILGAKYRFEFEGDKLLMSPPLKGGKNRWWWYLTTTTTRCPAWKRPTLYREAAQNYDIRYLTAGVQVVVDDLARWENRYDFVEWDGEVLTIGEVVARYANIPSPKPMARKLTIKKREEDAWCYGDYSAPWVDTVKSLPHRCRHFGEVNGRKGWLVQGVTSEKWDWLLAEAEKCFETVEVLDG